MPAGLLDVPASVLLNGVLTHLGPRDLVQLGRTCQYAHSLTDTDLVWARRLATDFHFPLDSSARPQHLGGGGGARAGWKTIYARLSRPHGFVWGEASHSRLGLASQRFPDEVHDMVRFARGGFPFPVPLSDLASPRALASGRGAHIGPTVQLHSTGWAFHALTASGHVLIWGTLDGEVYFYSRDGDDDDDETVLRSLRHPGYAVRRPTVLPIPPRLRIVQLGSARKHAVALARVRAADEHDAYERARELSSSSSSHAAKSATASSSSSAVDLAKAVILEWQAWGDVLRIDPSAFDDLPFTGPGAPSSHLYDSADVVQVEAGWEFSAVLLHRHRHASSTSTRTQGAARKTVSDVVCWLTSWSAAAQRQPGGGRSLNREQDEVEAATSALPSISPVVVQLPPLPPPPPGLLTRLRVEREQLRRAQSAGASVDPASSALEDYIASSQARRTRPVDASRGKGPRFGKEEEEEEEQLITKIAAGTSFLLALTSTGLVYRLDLLRGRPVSPTTTLEALRARAAAEEEGTFDEGAETVREAERFRRALYAAWASGREEEGWELLEAFCVPAVIGRCGPFRRSSSSSTSEAAAASASSEAASGLEGAGGHEKEEGASASASASKANALSGYVDASIRISHISAHFRNFAVYSVGAASELGIGGAGQAGGSRAGKSIVLLGDEGSTMFPEGIRRRTATRRAASAAPAPGAAGANDVEDNDDDEPPLVQPKIIPALQARSIIKVVHGDWHAGALDAQGRVLAWGQWAQGALGVWDALPVRQPAGVAGGRRGGAGPPFFGVGRMRLGLAVGAGWWGRRGGAPAPAPASPGQEEEDQDQEETQNEDDTADDDDAPPAPAPAPAQTQEDAAARLARRAALREIPAHVADPLEVRFEDCFEEASTATKGAAKRKKMFVFDLAMSGAQSGALAVEVDADDDEGEGGEPQGGTAVEQVSTSSASATATASASHADEPPQPRIRGHNGANPPPAAAANPQRRIRTDPVGGTGLPGLGRRRPVIRGGPRRE